MCGAGAECCWTPQGPGEDVVSRPFPFMAYRELDSDDESPWLAEVLDSWLSEADDGDDGGGPPDSVVWQPTVAAIESTTA